MWENEAVERDARARGRETRLGVPELRPRSKAETSDVRRSAKTYRDEPQLAESACDQSSVRPHFFATQSHAPQSHQEAMLRASVRSRVLSRAVAARSRPQWTPLLAQQRFYVDPRKPEDTTVSGVPTSAINTPGDPVVVPGNIPKAPPTPEEVGAEVGSAINKSIPSPTPLPPTGTGTASTGPAVQPKKKRRFRSFLLYLTLLSALGYGGGVYYSLQNDNFHDFFTEYVPFGEDAVAYLEEREFRKRFPTSSKPKLHEQVRGENKVKIGSKSGITARDAVLDKPSSDLGSTGKHMSALEENTPLKPTGALKEVAATENKPTPKKEKEPISAPAAKAGQKKDPAPQPEMVTTRAPPATGPIPAIDNLSIELGTEPAVQDVVKILNDIITVVNADGAQSKYSSTISTAKENLKKVITDISELKAKEQKAAEDKIRGLHSEFDDMAKELVRRQDESIRNQEMHWKEEYEAEQAKLKEAYEAKLKSEIEEANKVYEQKLKNQLLEQAIALRKDFTQQVRAQVEGEREGRLSKLDKLSSSVSDLEKLAGSWNEVVDANLKTQHLLVAVEAVRAKLDNAEKPAPFIEELAALKEVAKDDSIVNAAIASINPAAYQRGIPTASQLIDRFRGVAAEVRKASLLPENAGVVSHAASFLLSQVMFKKGGLPVGDDVESILARTEVLLEEGNLDHAAREMNGLTGWAKTLSRDWLGDVRKVLEVQQALDVIATEARLQSLLVD